MERITTSTREIDKHGPGRDGFTELPSPTQCNPDWFDEVQEEIARAIELHGVALDGGNLEQLSEVLLSHHRHAYQGSYFICDGFDLGSAGGLNVRVYEGSYFYEGTRIFMGDDVIDSIIAGGIITLANNDTNYIFIEVDDNPTLNQFYSYAATVGGLSYSPSLLYLGRVVTSAGAITSITADAPSSAISDILASNLWRKPHFYTGLVTNILLPNTNESDYPQIGADSSTFFATANQYFNRAHICQISQRPSGFTNSAGTPQAISFIESLVLTPAEVGSVLVVTHSQLERYSNIFFGALPAINANSGPLVQIRVELLGMTDVVSSNYTNTERKITGYYNVGTNTWTQLSIQIIGSDLVGAGAVLPTFATSYTANEGVYLSITNNSLGTVGYAVRINIIGNLFGLLEPDTLPAP